MDRMHGKCLLTTVMALMSTNFEGSSWPWVHRSVRLEVSQDNGLCAWPFGIATNAKQVNSGNGKPTEPGTYSQRV